MKLATERNMHIVKGCTVALGIIGLGITVYLNSHEGATFHSAVAMGYYEVVKLCQEALEPVLRFLEIVTEGGAAVVRETADAVESVADAAEEAITAR